MKSPFSLVALLLLQAPVAGEPAKRTGPAPFEVLTEAGRVFEYKAKVVSEEPRRNARGEQVDDADGNPAYTRKVARSKIKIIVQSVEKVAGTPQVELRTQVDGTAPERLFAVKWIAVTSRGVHDLASKKPSPALLAKILRRKPKWPLDAQAQECDPDREDIDSSDSSGRTTFTEGRAGSHQIRGRRAICRCYQLAGGSNTEDLTECLDPRVGFVQLSWSIKDVMLDSTYEWELTLVGSNRPDPSGSRPGTTGGKSDDRLAKSNVAPATPWPALDLAAVLPEEVKKGRQLYREAKACEQRRDHGCAVDRYTRALKANPADLVARFYLASAYEQSGRRDHAIRLFAELAYKKGCRDCQTVFSRVWLEGDLRALTASAEFKQVFRVSSGATAPAPVQRLSWPALDLYPVAAARAQEAIRDNNLGVRRHRAGEHQAAMEHFAAALRANPGHLLARYNLACAALRLRNKEVALSILRELAKAGCPECWRILSHARSDKDMDALQSSDEFQRLTAPAGAK